MTTIPTRVFASCLSIVSASAAVVVAAGTQLVPPLDPAMGSVDGRTAIAFFAQQDGVLKPAAGSEAHLVSDRDPESESVLPGGQWVRPDPGHYKAWVEGPGWISPSVFVVHYEAEPFTGEGLLPLVSAVRAGNVRWEPSGPPLASQPSVRLLHLESHRRGDHPAKEFSRRLAGDRLHEMVQLPTGKFIAGLFDLETQEYVALTAPLELGSSEVLALDPRPPARGRADLVVLLERAQRLATWAEDDLQVELDGVPRANRAPTATVSTDERYYAFWRDVPVGTATLQLRSSREWIAPVAVDLRSGRVATVRSKLESLRTLTGEFQLPPEAVEADMTVELDRLVTNQVAEPAVRSRLEPKARQTVSWRLVPGSYRVRFRSSRWTLVEDVELQSDATVRFEPELIRVHGTVYYGDGTASARLTFGRGGPGADVSDARVETSRQGEYEVGLFRRAQYLVGVEIDGRDGEPFWELVSVDGDMEYDFRIPENQYVVEVQDARSGQPVEGARIYSVNDAEDGQGGAFTGFTDVLGKVQLRPMRAGQLSGRVTADGFETARFGPVTVSEDDEVENDLAIALEPLEDAALVDLVLTGGGPASGARIGSFSTLDRRGALLWHGTAGADGTLRVPTIADHSYLVVTHPAAGALLVPWSSGEGGATEWVLPPAAPPLLLEARAEDGTPVRFVPISLRIGGRFLEGSALQFATETTPGLNGDGRWEPRHLPSEPLEVSFWLPAGTPGEGTVRAESRWLSPPWPRPMRVELHAGSIAD